MLRLVAVSMQADEIGVDSTKQANLHLQLKNSTFSGTRTYRKRPLNFVYMMNKGGPLRLTARLKCYELTHTTAKATLPPMDSARRCLACWTMACFLYRVHRQTWQQGEEKKLVHTLPLPPNPLVFRGNHSTSIVRHPCGSKINKSREGIRIASQPSWSEHVIFR
ncbi:hypothetical protein DXT99_25125 [Pontibacter diazotrophicus]|uniref:Uncharacterized protein n=1 Tax=Pontibacter diazotrophicus TaxID=1400979 RepID=A0A3D8L1J9_9BACT|nr:hypothetical protein DXT99_25125 [Pontibacter diazotrophicus]